MPLRTEVSRAKKVRFRSNQLALLVAPPVLLASMYLAYRGFALWHLAPLSVRSSTMPGGAGGIRRRCSLTRSLLGLGRLADGLDPLDGGFTHFAGLSGLGALKYFG